MYTNYMRLHIEIILIFALQFLGLLSWSKEHEKCAFEVDIYRTHCCRFPRMWLVVELDKNERWRV